MHCKQNALCQHLLAIKIVVYSPNIAGPADVHAADNGRNSMVHMERSGVQSLHYEPAASQSNGRMGDDKHSGKMWGITAVPHVHTGSKDRDEHRRVAAEVATHRRTEKPATEKESPSEIGVLRSVRH